MRGLAVLGVAFALTSAGCACEEMGGQAAERDFSGLTRRANPSLRAGEAHVIDAHARARLPLRTEGAARAQLDDGRFIVCWTRGSTEEGRRALAQAFRRDGSPMGAPVVISPPGVDVLEAPKAIATDGQHVIATFAAASDRSIDVLAVPIEAQTMGAGGGDRIAAH